METVALRTPRLDVYSGQSLTTPSTSIARRTLAFRLCAIQAALLPLTEVLSASKELTWTQMATLKPREILRHKARHN
uniref:Uncharacterized protein n=1 Tax=Oryza rufipogon TaxID=4529 RepID=A0A0E0N4B6_ORYRU